jgi:hypothetical protein
MKETTYKIGDKVWLYVGNHGGKTSEGKVVHIFNLDWGSTFYVIEIDTHVDPLLQVRDWMTLADEPGGRIGLFKSMGGKYG